jgi:hypothetical protein
MLGHTIKGEIICWATHKRMRSYARPHSTAEGLIPIAGVVARPVIGL